MMIFPFLSIVCNPNAHTHTHCSQIPSIVLREIGSEAKKGYHYAVYCSGAHYEAIFYSFCVLCYVFGFCMRSSLCSFFGIALIQVSFLLCLFVDYLGGFSIELFK